MYLYKKLKESIDRCSGSCDVTVIVVKTTLKPYNKYCTDMLLSGSRFPKQQIFDSFKLKEFADNNFKFHEYGRKFSKRVENTVGKGEIAHYEQFLLFPQCSKRLLLQTCKNQGLFSKEISVTRDISLS